MQPRSGRQRHVRDSVADIRKFVKYLLDNPIVTSLPAGASTEAKQDTTIISLASLLTELQLKADLTETQPVHLSLGSTSTITSVTQNIASVTILAANANRKSVTIVNDTNHVLYITFGNVVASTTNYSVKLFSQSQRTIDETTEQLNGIWSGAGTDLAMITETV